MQFVYLSVKRNKNKKSKKTKYDRKIDIVVSFLFGAIIMFFLKDYFAQYVSQKALGYLLIFVIKAFVLREISFDLLIDFVVEIFL